MTIKLVLKVFSVTALVVLTFVALGSRDMATTLGNWL